LAEQIAQLNLQFTILRSDSPPAQDGRMDMRRNLQRRHQVARCNCRQLTEFARKQKRDLGRGSNVVKIPAALVRHCFQKMLIKTKAHAEGGSRKTAQR